jgi:uncharacterized phosphatase
MKHLYFVRHGESELGAKDLGAGHSETPLTEKGRQQAHLTGQSAKNLKLDYIVSSPLSRAYETAEIIAKEIGFPAKKIKINKLFIERYFGNYEGQPIIYDPNYDFDSINGIEKTDDLLNRARKALDYLEAVKADNVLVVAHGQFGRALRHHVLADFPFNQVQRLQNGEIVQWI